MAQTTKGGVSGMLAEMDQPTRIKLIAVAAVLLFSLVWILYYLGVFAGDPNKPNVSEAERQQAEQEVIREQKEIETASPPRPVRGKPAPVSGS